MSIPFSSMFDQQKRQCQHCGSFTMFERCEGCGSYDTKRGAPSMTDWNVRERDWFKYSAYIGAVVVVVLIVTIESLGLFPQTKHTGTVIGRDFHRSTHIGKFYRRERWCLIVKDDTGEAHHVEVSREQYETIPDGTFWNPK